MAANPKLIAKIEAEEPTQRLAVLIDADNAQAAILDGLFAEIARLGEATVKRIYGDFTNPTSAQWKKVLNKFAIKPMQQYAYTTGKNATDGALIIDAMDLLYTGRFHGFCLVSSDSDFTGIATRIREEGLVVYGFGEQKTPEAFRNACNKFIFTEVLRPVTAPSIPTPAVASPPVAASSQPTPAAPVASTTPHQEAPPPPPFPVEFFRQALEQASNESGWATLAQFGNYLSNLKPDFDPRMFDPKYKKLSDLVRAHPELFKLEERNKVMYVRAK